MGYIVTGRQLWPCGWADHRCRSVRRRPAGQLRHAEERRSTAPLSLVLIAIFLVLFFFKDTRTERAPFVFRPRDITDSLIAVRGHPMVLKILPVYSFFMIANVTFYVFVDNFLTSAWGYGVIGGSMAMVVIGLALAFPARFL